jgi:hypothetical protein
MGRTRTAALAVGVAVAAAVAAVAPGTAAASAAPAASAVTVVARGLDGPYGLQFTGRHALVVTEADVGDVTAVNTATGAQRTLLKRLTAPAGVGVRHGRLYVALGESQPDMPPTAPRPAFRGATVVTAGADGSRPRVLADLMAYERRVNPDRQVQFVGGKPVDALSNPFSLDISGYAMLVADGGANAVLRVDRTTGRTSTFFVPPTIRTGECARRPNNGGTFGCDSVPTGIAVARGSIYVSTLGSEAPGAARIYRLNPHDGRVVQTWGGLTGLTGVAVAPDGTVFASQVFEGMPATEGPPPPGFDPSTVGQIVRIEPNGRRTHAQVTMPTGLTWHDGALHSTAWSVASFMGMPRAGQVVRVPAGAFR